LEPLFWLFFFWRRKEDWMKKVDEDGIDEFDEMGEMCEITLYI